MHEPWMLFYPALIVPWAVGKRAPPRRERVCVCVCVRAQLYARGGYGLHAQRSNPPMLIQSHDADGLIICRRRQVPDVVAGTHAVSRPPAASVSLPHRTLALHRQAMHTHRRGACALARPPIILHHPALPPDAARRPREPGMQPASARVALSDEGDGLSGVARTVARASCSSTNLDC